MADSRELAEYKARLKYTAAQDKLLTEAWMKLALGEQATQKSLGDLRAKRASDFTKNAAGYLRARDSGTAAARVRAAVELAKLKATAPVEFARAATLPDRNLQTTITQGLSAEGLAETPDKDVDKARKAWQMFLTSVQPSSANVLGSYEWMVETYGDPGYLGVNDGPLRDKLAAVLQKREVEQKNAAEFDASLEKLGTSWATYLRNNPNLDPEADSTFEAFQRDAAIDLSILPGAGSPFIQNIEDVAKNPEAHPTFFSDIDARDKASNVEQARYEGLLAGVGGGSVLDVEGAPGEANDDSMRAFLAAWVRRPEVQWWAEQNGFQLGKAEPVDPESDFGKEVAAGRVPGQMLVNGMLYSARPDDLRAFRLAHAQMEQDPEDNLFRALGLAHKAGPRRLVEVEEIVEPGTPDLNLVKRGLDDTGAIALDAEGNYHTSLDGGKTWTPADKAEAQARMDAAEKAGDVDATPVTVPGIQPTTRTRKLEYREPVYGRDYPNSVRGVDPETGEEVYLPPEKVAKTTFPDGQRTKGPSLVERINQVSAKATRKRGEKPAAPAEAPAAPPAAPAAEAPAPKRTLVEAQRERLKTSGLRAPVDPTRESDQRVETLKARTGLDGAAKVAEVPDLPARAAPASLPPVGQKPEAPTPVPDASRLRAPIAPTRESAQRVAALKARKGLDAARVAEAPRPSTTRPAPPAQGSKLTAEEREQAKPPRLAPIEDDVEFKTTVADIEIEKPQADLERLAREDAAAMERLGVDELPQTATSSTVTPTVSTAAAAQKKALEESRKRQKQAEVAKQMAGAGATPGAAL